jgi:hypothetical protein
MTDTIAQDRRMTPPATDLENPDRRAVLRRLTVCLVGAVGAVAACQRGQELGPECEAQGELSEADVRMRTTLEYFDLASDPKKACTECRQFVPAPQGNACGTCKLVRGAIHPKGTCKVFAPKV